MRIWPSVPCISVAISALDGNFEVDGLEQGARPASRIVADSGIIALGSSFSVIEAHLSPDLAVFDSGMDQAGNDGARRRAIRARICPNILAETATSATRDFHFGSTCDFCRGHLARPEGIPERIKANPDIGAEKSEAEG